MLESLSLHSSAPIGAFDIVIEVHNSHLVAVPFVHMHSPVLEPFRS
jgi:hypothetical protein